MKHKILTTVSLIILSVISFAPNKTAAQASGAVSGAASCAMGGAIASAITNALGGAASGAVSDGITSSVGGAVPVIAPTANTRLDQANSKLSAQNQKSFTLDRLASCAAKQLLHQMTADTISWINTGFKGGPAFLTNPQAFLLDSADQLTGAMISDSGPLKGLCSPWNVDIRLALALEQSGGAFNTSRYTCTLSRIVTNAQNARVNVSLDGFMAGDFTQGGWGAFIDMTVGSQNPAAQYIMAKSDLQAAIDKGTTAINKDLDRGFGFLSDTECQTVNLQSAKNTPGTAGPGETQNIIPDPNGVTGKLCTTKTPGSVIAHALNVHTDSGVVEAELANDINSVVSALVTQLTSQMLTKGLASLSGSHSGVTVSGQNNLTSYINQLQTTSRAPEVINSGGTLYTVKDGAITSAESPLVGIYTEAINAVSRAQASYETTRTCYSNLLQLTPNNSNQIARFQPDIDTINSVLNTKIVPLLNTLNSQKTAASTLTTITSDDVSKTQAADDDALLKAQTWNSDAVASLYSCQNAQ